MYTEFAELYDELMNDVDYVAWAEQYASLMSLYGQKSGNVCECACGTGSLTLCLQEMGYHMTGVDLSQDMLFRASEKARKAGCMVPFVRQDMRCLQLHRPMDAVLATCDGVNYLLTQKDLKAFFTHAWQALKPGGCLIFDVSTPYKLEHILGDRMLMEDTERITYVWQNHYEKRTRLVDMQLCFFVREPDGRYRRIDEEQTQAAHTQEELTECLSACGFDAIRFFAEHGTGAPDAHAERWHIAARKVGKEEKA